MVQPGWEFERDEAGGDAEEGGIWGAGCTREAFALEAKKPNYMVFYLN